MSGIPIIKTDRLIITVLKPENCPLLVTYFKDNQAHLSPWEPLRESNYFSNDETKRRIQEGYDNFLKGTAVHFIGLNKSENEIVGLCNFTNIIRGPFQACHLGYSIGEKYQGKRFMYEILKPAVDHIFSNLGLHRIMANYIPCNHRSAKLLSQLGFEKEGLAKSYIKIAGRWQDHVLTSKINPQHH